MVTIKMVAQKCGFSTATVSKALNGAPDISTETAEFVRKTAAEMGYMPNSAARILKTSRSRTLGVLFEEKARNCLTSNFFSSILNGFKNRAEQLGFDVSFVSGYLDGRKVSYVEHARYRSCDGVLIACVDYTDQAAMELVNSGIPVVTIDCVFDNCGSVVSDNVRGMADLVNYICRMGHRKIAYVHGEDSPVTRQRVESFLRTCSEHGITVREEYLVPAVYRDPKTAGKITGKLLDLPDPPTCILYSDDISHTGGIREIERRGLSVPEDISVAGYDGLELSQMLRPKLTTLRQDSQRMGESAAEELAKAVADGSAYQPGRIVVPGILLPGESVKKLTP